MESGAIVNFIPDWVANPIREQAYIHPSDSISTKLNKAEQKEGGLPSWEYYQNLPDHTLGPVPFAEQLGRQARQEINQQIGANMEAGHQRIKANYGPLLTQGVDVWA